MGQRLVGRGCALVAASCAVLFLECGHVARGADVGPTVHRTGDAPRLVQAALDAELAGDPARRKTLLAEALEADPEFAPARWHSGQLKFDGQWRDLDDVASLTTNHRRWVEYRELRVELGDGPDAHAALAEYCRDNGLANEERYHWANVLLADPAHVEARKRLGLREYRGGLFTEEQMAVNRQRAEAAKDNLKRFQVQFTRLCRDATSGDAARREPALAEIRRLADPAAIEALEMAAAKACERSPARAEALHLAVVAALANMPQHEATLRLLNHAVYAESDAVRTRAARALRPRPQTDYVPLLMAALRSPVEVEVDVLATPDGSVRLTETLRQDGPQGDAAHVRSTNYLVEGALRYDPAKSNPGVVLQRHMDRAADAATETQLRAEAHNAAVVALNARIEAVLRVATGSDLDESPQTWWEEWVVYNELESLGEEPVLTSYEEANYEYFYPQGRVLTPVETRFTKTPRREPAEPARVRRYRTGAPILPTIRRELNGAPVGLITSCFVPGTPVWTQSGLVPIERVAVGDMVLGQNPHTGEVAFRPVLETMFGPPVPVLYVHAGNDTLGATRGHRFWSVGRGWTMAKLLETSDRLHAFDGPVEIASIEPGRDREQCYNLIVDEFHTYYVGEERLLVHDFTCPQPELASIPGSATLRTDIPMPQLAEAGR